MDWIKLKDNGLSFLRKYRYAAAVLLLGVALMLLPGKKADKKETVTVDTDREVVQRSEEERLAMILAEIHGVGKVQVMLTVSSGAETVYQTDEDCSRSDTASSEHRDTVTVTGSEREQMGLIRQINPPIYLGALVVCQGADRPSVRLAVIDAVSKVTDLGADRISVVKMR